MTLVNEVKFKVVEDNAVAVFNAGFAHLLNDTLVADHALEVHKGFAVVEVDTAHEPLQPFALNDPILAFLGNGKIVGILRFFDYVGLVRFVNGKGRKLLKHFVYAAAKRLDVLTGSGADINDLKAVVCGVFFKARRIFQGAP